MVSKLKQCCRTNGKRKERKKTHPGCGCSTHMQTPVGCTEPALPSTTVHAYTHAPPRIRCHWPPLGGPPLSHRPYQHSWAREKAGAEEETPCFPGRRRPRPRPGPVARSPPARPTKFGPPGPGPRIWDLEGGPGDAGCEPFRLRTPLVVLDGPIQVTAERGVRCRRRRRRPRVARAHVARVARAQAATAPVSHTNMGDLRRCAVIRFVFTIAQTQQHDCIFRLCLAALSYLPRRKKGSTVRFRKLVLPHRSNKERVPAMKQPWRNKQLRE